MNIPPPFSQVIPMEWWTSEMKDHPYDHIGPASVLAVTTVTVIAVWGKRRAVGFLTIAFLSYPYTYPQIQYLLNLDTNLTAYAVAVVSIQTFCIKFPLLSIWGLPMSVALAYAMTVHGIRLRQLLEKQGSQIKDLTTLNDKLTKQVDSLMTNSTDLKKALTSLRSKIQKKNQVTKAGQSTAQTRNDIVNQIEKEYADTIKLISELTEQCKVAADDGGILKQLNQVDTNKQTIAQQTAQIELKNQELTKILTTLEEANTKFHELLDRAQTDETQTLEGLKQFNTWFLSLNKIN